MNRQFYEFWGKYFTSVAHGQKQLEDMSAWMKHGFTGTDDLTALFRRCYGLNAAEPGGALDVQTWQKTICHSERLHVPAARKIQEITGRKYLELSLLVLVT